MGGRMSRFFVLGLDATGSTVTVVCEGNDISHAKSQAVALDLLASSAAAKPAPEGRANYLMIVTSTDGKRVKANVEASSLASAISKFRKAGYVPAKLLQIDIAGLTGDAITGKTTFPASIDLADELEMPPPGKLFFVDGFDMLGGRTIKVYASSRQEAFTSPEVRNLRIISSIRADDGSHRSEPAFDYSLRSPRGNGFVVRKPLTRRLEQFLAELRMLDLRDDQYTQAISLHPSVQELIEGYGLPQTCAAAAAVWWMNCLLTSITTSGGNTSTAIASKPILDICVHELRNCDEFLSEEGFEAIGEDFIFDDSFFGMRYPYAELRLELIRIASWPSKRLCRRFVQLSTGIVETIADADGRITRKEKAGIQSTRDSLVAYFDPPAEPKKRTGAAQGQPKGQARKQLRVRSEPDAAEAVDELADARAELDSLTGLNGIKREVTKFEALLNIKRQREAAGLPSPTFSLHFVFHGNPGTGKTTVARILGRIMKGYGLLERGHVIETDRSGMVAEYLGQTAVKTTAKIDEALDGILFVDEAYTLSRSTAHGDGYGQEAIDTLLKRMEDQRDRLSVIVAGYPAPMTQFINSNPGLKSRFTRYLTFSDYSTVELEEIFSRIAEKHAYKLSLEARARLQLHIQTLHATKDEKFGNAREMRNLFEAVISNQAMRLSDLGRSATEHELHTLDACDFEMS
jgi:hypothetical protein